MATLHIYLNFPGTCEQAFNFYQSVLGGEIGYIGRFGEVPPMEGQPPVPEEHKNKVMHVSMETKNLRLLGSDVIEGFGPPVVFGNNFAVSIDCQSKEEAEALFSGLSAGGDVSMPIQDTFWNAYFGMFTDKFGIQWMVNFDYPGGEMTS
jgi:PhnB protein